MQYFPNHTLPPANPSPPHHLLPSSPVTLLPSPPIFHHPYPPGLPTYAGTARAPVHSLPMSLAGNHAPFSHSNYYPIPHSTGSVPPQQYSSVLPHSVGRSPPYRQMSGRQNQPVTLVQYPTRVNPPYPHSQMYGAGSTAQVPCIPSNTGPPSRHTSAPPTVTSSRQPHDPRYEQRRPPGKRNRQKTTQQGNN